LHLVGYLCYWQMGFNSMFEGLKEPLARYTFLQERTLGIFGRCCPEDEQRHITNFLNDCAVNKSSLQAYGSKALQSVINVGCSETRC